MDEPWLRGAIEGVHPRVAPVLYAFQQAREDLAQHTEGLSEEQLWTAPPGSASVGFHLRHIAGSVERLMTYVQGRLLSEQQMAALKAEEQRGGSRQDLLAAMDHVFREAEAVVRGLDPGVLAEPRSVGRKGLPTTVIGLITHMAEHTQRHIGETIILARWVRR